MTTERNPCHKWVKIIMKYKNNVQHRESYALFSIYKQCYSKVYKPTGMLSRISILKNCNIVMVSRNIINIIF